ncbi:MAG: nitroreductase family protein [Spirochaetales bacterium]|nr:nitroreductase family protein [Spirochaetales bacterium]
MDVFEAINKRYSHKREFKDEPVPRETLKKIVQAGIQAPSGCNEQTTDFVIVDDPALIREIAAITERPFIKTAGAIIACIVNQRPVYRGLSFEVEDCSAAVENMLLSITALGYAAVWIEGNILVEGKPEKLNSLLKVPAPKYVRVLLPLGIPPEQGTQKEKKPFARRAWFNTYDG